MVRTMNLYGHILGFLDPNEDSRQAKNSVVLVRERTIPTERPPLVGEVIDNFCG
jgi:hypothetical protein